MPAIQILERCIFIECVDDELMFNGHAKVFQLNWVNQL